MPVEVTEPVHVVIWGRDNLLGVCIEVFLSAIVMLLLEQLL